MSLSREALGWLSVTVSENTLVDVMEALADIENRAAVSISSMPPFPDRDKLADLHGRNANRLRAFATTLEAVR